MESRIRWRREIVFTLDTFVLLILLEIHQKKFKLYIYIYIQNFLKKKNQTTQLQLSHGFIMVCNKLVEWGPL